MKPKRYKSLRPYKFNFMGRVYEVSYKDALPDDNLGTTYHDTLKIEIKDNQVPIEEADTVVHEIFHTLWHLMGLTADLDDVLEERVVRTMSTALVAAFDENPMLLEYLRAALKKEA